MKWSETTRPTRRTRPTCAWRGSKRGTCKGRSWPGTPTPPGGGGHDDGGEDDDGEDDDGEDDDDDDDEEEEEEDDDEEDDQKKMGSVDNAF